MKNAIWSVSAIFARTRYLALLVLTGFTTQLAHADGVPVFHLTFTDFTDVSGNNMDIEVGDSVSLVPGGGPLLASGDQLNAGKWDGGDDNFDDTSQILILDNESLDQVAVSAGSIVSWIRPDDGDEWNNIAKTICEDHVEPCDAFGQYLGIEFQATGPHAGVFGAVQGWDTNNFGPEAPDPFGSGPTDTPSGEWSHAALVWNENGDHTIFLNGEPGETVIGVGVDDFGLNEPGDWIIGGDSRGTNAANPDSSRQLIGDLADFAIYDGALTQQELQTIIQSGVPTSGAAPKLQAGDSDMDLDFDQLDLVQVQIAAKYLSGQPATWGQGDWNGAPGGSQGAPPAGNGLFDQLDIIAALAPGHYLAGPYAAIGNGGSPDDAQTSISYDPATGELGVDAPAGTELTSINIDSAASIFTGSPADNLGGSFDNDADDNIFKATFGQSFGSLSFGTVAQAGLSEEFVAGDLTVVGSLNGGGDLGAVDLIYVPEPSAVLLLTLGVFSLVATGRRRQHFQDGYAERPQ